MPINDELTVRYHDTAGHWHIGKRIADQLYRKGYDRLRVKLELVNVNQKKGTVTYRVTDDARGREESKALPASKNQNRATPISKKGVSA